MLIELLQSLQCILVEYQLPFEVLLYNQTNLDLDQDLDVPRDVKASSIIHSKMLSTCTLCAFMLITVVLIFLKLLDALVCALFLEEC